MQATAYSPVVSTSGAAIADALISSSKNLRNIPLLRGATYNRAAFDAAVDRATSVLETAARTAGTTTLRRADLQQLLLAGTNILYRLGLNVRASSTLEGADYRAYELRVGEYAQTLASQMATLAQLDTGGVAGLAKASDVAVGIFLPLPTTAVQLFASYMRMLDNGEDLARDLCEQNPESTACARAMGNYQANLRTPADPFGPPAAGGVEEAIASLIKWGGVGAAVLGIGYGLWVFGPALIGFGKTVRRGSKAKFRS